MEFHVVDVFAARAFRGNPVLVALAPEGLEAAPMQEFAAWNGLPETVYLRPVPGAHDAYAARIFSPRAELAFAGHPTLGAAHVALETGLVARPAMVEPDEELFGPGALERLGGADEPSSGPATRPRVSTPLWQHGAAGRVELRLLHTAAGAPQMFVKTPAPGHVEPVPADVQASAAQALGAAPGLALFRVAAGAQWLVAALAEPAELEALRPDLPAIEALSLRLGVSGITVYAPGREGSQARFEVRSFGPAIGVPEDAVCGGGNACVAVLQHHLQPDGPPAYRTAQGRFVGRDGGVQLAGPVAGGRFWLGGSTRTRMTGTVHL